MTSVGLQASEEDSSRFWLKLSSDCADPLCKAFKAVRYDLVKPLDPTKFDNETSKTKEVFKRILIAVVAFFAFTVALPFTLTACLGLGCASKIFRAIGFAVQRKGYTHIRGTAPEKTLVGPPRILTWNLCGPAGGMHYDHGGVNTAERRLPSIVAKIRRADADVVVLQEIYDTALAEAIIRELGPDYAHIYAHLGVSVWGSSGGCMVLSKCAVHRFTNVDFNNSNWQLRRGFAVIEIKSSREETEPCARIIGTHLIHGQNEAAQRKRMEQMVQIVDFVARCTLPLPTVMVADANIQKGSAEEAAALTPYLKPGYEGPFTCTSQLVRQWKASLNAPDENIDIVSLFKEQVLPDGQILPVIEQGVELANCQRIEAFDETYDTGTADSDHIGLYADLIMPKQPQNLANRRN